MNKITTTELKKIYLDFFKTKNHAVIGSAPLIPEHDPTVLFTTAGMHPLVPFLMGEAHPNGKRLVNFQKCVRTGDIEEVGDNRHLTFFEMLGNWSLGDYFKKEAIAWSFEFLTAKLKIPVEKLFVTCFEGDKDAPKDEESATLWEKTGVLQNHIFFLPKKDNWWGPAGETGPCGPDTEIFYYVGEESWNGKTRPGDESGEFIEIWNDVFMSYNRKFKDQNSKIKYYFEPLKRKNVDTGLGVERTVAVMSDLADVYRVDSLWPLVVTVMNLLRIEESEQEAYYQKNKKPLRVIVDHFRAATFILGDERGVTPSNLDQGYVLRRLIRRAVRFGKQLGLSKEICLSREIAAKVIDFFEADYPELARNRDKILDELAKEEAKFEKTLERGLKVFNRMTHIGGAEAFQLSATYGFPFEMTQELALERNIVVNSRQFEEEYKKHQALSRKGSEKRFKGGLADASEISKKYHTATHLLHQALREVLGQHVEQRGSNITAERLRFDFSHPVKLTPEEKQKVEKLVNAQIAAKIPIEYQVMKVNEAKNKGAIGLFTAKYGERVKVYEIGDFSKEICGGPHADNTGDLGHFRIKKEEASSAGVRRIKAVLE